MEARALRNAVPFGDRREAGRKLAAKLHHLEAERPIVIGLPRGGVPVAFEIARALDAPLDVVLVRKLGMPIQPELAVGALGEDDVLLVNRSAVTALGVTERELAAVIADEARELERRRVAYRGGREPEPVDGRCVILVDDGIATGASAAAAGRVLRARGAARIVLAVPVAPPGAESRFEDLFDEFVCVAQPQSFFAVGQAYEDFGETTDQEVRELLAASGRRGPEANGEDGPRDGGRMRPPGASETGDFDWGRIARDDATIEAPGQPTLAGDLRIPPAADGLVIFAHGSGSSRRSPRNVQVASALNAAGLGTLLFDLLSEEEAADRRLVFDIELLTERLVSATRWAASQPRLEGFAMGYFGASTGAAAALGAAAELDGEISAVVSRGGRPDLAADRLADVTAPTLLIVGGEDREVLELNRRAAALLACPHRIEVVPGATHLFEEPGALEGVSRLAAAWFRRYLADDTNETAIHRERSG